MTEKIGVREIKDESTTGYKATYALIKRGDNIYCAWCGVNIKYLEDENLHVNRHAEVDNRLNEIEGMLNL